MACTDVIDESFVPIEPAISTPTMIHSPRPRRQGSENFVLSLAMTPRDLPQRVVNFEKK